MREHRWHPDPDPNVIERIDVCVLTADGVSHRYEIVGGKIGFALLLPTLNEMALDPCRTRVPRKALIEIDGDRETVVTVTG